MEHGGENLGLHEDDIYNKLPTEYKQYFQPEYTENGNRSGHEFATPLQRKRDKKGGFGFGYHNEIGDGNILFIERWIPSKSPKIKRWDELRDNWLSKINGPLSLVNEKQHATSILLELNHDKIEKIIDKITTFLDAISMEEHDSAFLEAVKEKLY